MLLVGTRMENKKEEAGNEPRPWASLEKEGELNILL
jgi:hypothetical protein